MRLSTVRLQAVFHLRMAHGALVGEVDHDMTVAEWAALDAATQHVRAALRALGHDVDLHERTSGGV